MTQVGTGVGLRSSHAHDVFISYSRKDKAFAVALENALRRYKPPSDLGVRNDYVNVFRDENDFTAGDYGKILDEELKSSAALVVICSPNARKSPFVDDEIRRFARSKGANADIIPILISGVPNNEADAAQDAQKAFPQALCDVMQLPLAISYLDFNTGLDKVTRGNFEGCWYTLLANIFHVSRAVIEQRDKKRKARVRNSWIAALAAVATAFGHWASGRSSLDKKPSRREMPRLPVRWRCTVAQSLTAALMAGKRRQRILHSCSQLRVTGLTRPMMPTRPFNTPSTRPRDNSRSSDSRAPSEQSVRMAELW